MADSNPGSQKSDEELYGCLALVGFIVVSLLIGWLLGLDFSSNSDHLRPDRFY